MQIGVIGAGPAGLTAAYQLSKTHPDIHVWEADKQYVGGISRTVIYKGYRFDIGGHRFYSKSKEIEDLWTEILPNDMLNCNRLSRIYYQEKFYSYPLDIGEVIENIGKRRVALTLGSYFKAKVFTPSNPDNLEDWVTRKFGGRLYQMFFKSYTEKVWGMPCREISSDWAAQRIKGLSLSKAARNALRPKPMAQSPGDRRGDPIKTLITSFRYPRLGPGMLWEAAAAQVQQRGGQILMGSCVNSLELRPDATWRVQFSQSGSVSHRDVDQLICSAPMSWLIAAIQPALPAEALEAAAGLRYRDFLTVALILKPRVTFPDNWIYIHDPGLKVGRIQNFGNWSAAMVPEADKACYGMEYFTNTDEELWQMEDSRLIELATQELITLRLSEPGDVIDGAVVRQAKAYPVYDDDYQQRRDVIRRTLQEHCPNLHIIGRNGMHQYNNQDHSMMTAMLTARNIQAGREIYNPWQVNQDAEYLEAGQAAA
ncbi:MAG: NAD(P)/FAD-dependent oxidoreductase [Cyanobacteriota bacterium]|nr:NAD(P)/FAD-dependent oxidoreductase [Cyanobacteriota bacterium]